MNVRSRGLLSQTMEEEEEEQPESMDVDSPVSLKDELPYEPLSIEVNDKYFTFFKSFIEIIRHSSFSKPVSQNASSSE